MTAPDMEYFAKRERREREQAARSSDAAARRIHLEMADRYLARLSQLGATRRHTA